MGESVRIVILCLTYALEIFHGCIGSHSLLLNQFKSDEITTNIINPTARPIFTYLMVFITSLITNINGITYINLLYISPNYVFSEWIYHSNLIMYNCTL